MSFFNKVKCKMGFHKWKTEDPSIDGGWYYYNDSCEQKRSCVYCQIIQTRINHDWERIYDKNDDLRDWQNGVINDRVYFSSPLAIDKCKRCKIEQEYN
jgi:hypothetical protein